ncbi:uncharacterized protein [Chelonus insularis]|uniref:uncharacterized protein n=1 Tax=Chelonus insularis TaxID=460826 RepID=UPI00158F2B90|nr:uncharacterized protein LOC118072260 [Chelonus insularis]
MRLVKTFFRRIIKDLCQKELLPLKVIFFVKASTLLVLYPYLTIHKRELGINIEETAIMSSITPIVAIIMPTLAGLVADRVGNFKIILAFFSSIGGAAALLLLLVPVGRINVKYPKELVMDLGNSGNSSDLIFSLNQMEHYCETELKDEITAKIRSCGYACPSNFQDQERIKSIISSRTYVVEFFDPDVNHNFTFKYERSEGDYGQREMTKTELFEERIFRSNLFYNTAVRQLSKNTLFFPTEEFYQFSCQEFDSGKNEYNNLTLCKFQEFLIPSRNIEKKHSLLPFKVKMKKLPLSDEDLYENQQKLHVEVMSLNAESVIKKFNLVQCENTNSRTRRVSVTVYIGNSTVESELEPLSIEGCHERCIVTATRNDICSNKNIIIEYNPQLTFWLYLMIRVLIGIIGSTAFAMFEGAVIAILREQKADYGLQRIYGSLGGMISSPLSGLLIDYASQGKEYSDFRPAFYLYAALKLASGVLMLTINLEFKAPAHNVIKDFIDVLKNIEIAALMLACFMLGTIWGFLESFLFWLLQDLGGSNSLMGVTITVGGITGIPLLAFSGPIVNKIGHPNVLFIGFIFYAVRLIGYSFIYNPWHSLIFEALESVTTSLSFTAAVTYAAKLSTTSTDSSIQGLLGSMYYGVGKGSGSLVGGFIMKAIGTRNTYRIFAVVSIITGIIYFFFNALYLKKRPQVEGNDIVKKEPKKKTMNGIEASSIDAIEKKIKNNKYNLKRIENGVSNKDSDGPEANFKALEADKYPGTEKIGEELKKGIELKILKKEEELKELENESKKLNEELKDVKESTGTNELKEPKEDKNKKKIKNDGQLGELKKKTDKETEDEELKKELKNNSKGNLNGLDKDKGTDINSGDSSDSCKKTRNSEGVMNLRFENETTSKCSVTVEREAEEEGRK